MKENFIMINDCIKQFSLFPSCITFPPCTEESITHVSTLLSASGFSTIPAEYKEFLKITDGLSYNGIEFFGARSHNRPEKGYTFPDLAASTFHYEDYDFFRRKIILGRVSESMIFYDKLSNHYAIADRLTLRSRREVKSFAEILQIFLDICKN